MDATALRLVQSLSILQTEIGRAARSTIHSRRSNHAHGGIFQLELRSIHHFQELEKMEIRW